MSEHFDVIVVGGGFAGASTAIRLAQNGVRTLLVERGDEGGAKNLSGGVLWGDDLAAVVPDWKAKMPLERPVHIKKVGFLAKAGGSFVIDYADPALKTTTLGHTVLRARTDPWLLAEAKNAGATVVVGVNVEALHKENGVVRGVVQDGEITTADVVVVADGANSRLTLQGDLRHGEKKLDMDHYALGVKEVLRLPKETLEDRFHVGDGGLAGEYVLGRDDGVMAGGFLYTNKDTVSLGVVINLRSMKGRDDLATHDIVEQFRNHPHIAALTKGAELVEYGAHLVPEGGYQSFSELYADGVLVVGDAAGFCFSNGIVIQGMNYAVRSGIAAADTILVAKQKGDYSAVTLKAYVEALERDGMLGDFKRFKNVSKVLWNPRMFREYPELLTATFRSILGSTGPKKRLRDHLQAAIKAVGVRKKDLAMDGLRAGMEL